MDNQLKFIGEINTPYKELSQCPMDSFYSEEICSLTIFEEYAKGLFALERGQKIILLYWLDKAERKVDITSSRNKNVKGLRGTFALRTPARPNPIGLSIVVIEDIEENKIFVKGLDCLDKTMLLDIKPVFDEA